MKRVLLVAFSVALLSGCRQEPETAGRTVIRYLAEPDVGGFKAEIIRRFEAENPDISVEMVEGPAATNTREDMYAAAFMAEDDGYDMVWMDVAWVPKFAAQGWLRPLDASFTQEMQALFLPGDVEGSRVQGKIYRFPVQSDGGMLYYRKDLLAAQGIPAPKTWAELLAAAKRLQRPPELWGFVFQGKQYEGLTCVYLELLWGNGGDVISKAGELLIDRPEAIEALRWLVDAVHKDKIAPPGVLTFQEEEARQMFQEGRAVFMRNWPYAWALGQKKDSPVRGKIGIVPMVGSGGRRAATLGGWGYAISAYSRNPEAAWKFLEFNGRPENQKLAFEKGGILPARKSLYSDPAILKRAPHMKQMGEVLARARPRPTHASYARLSDIIQLHLSAALSLQETPEQALSAAASEMRAFLAR